MLHVWGAIVHGHKFPLVRLDLKPAHQEGGKRIAAQTINDKVYVVQILGVPASDQSYVISMTTLPLYE